MILGVLMVALMSMPVPAQVPAPDRTFTSDVPIGVVGFSPDGRELIGLGLGSVRVWDINSGSQIRSFPLEEGYTLGTAASSAGSILAAGHPSGTVQVFSPEDGAVVFELDGHQDLPYGYQYGVSDDDALLATASKGHVNVWSLTTGELLFDLDDGPGATVGFAFSPDNRFLAGANEDTNVRVWSLESGALVAVIDDLDLLTPSLAFTPDGSLLVGANVDRQVYLWSVFNWERIRQFEQTQPEAAWMIDISPDGRYVATGGMDVDAMMNPAHVVIWELESGEPIRTLRFENQPLGIRFSPDGRYLAVADISESVKLFVTSELVEE